MPTTGGSGGGNYYAFFTTVNPSTGAAQNADSLPTALAYKNAVDDHIAFPLTVANVSTGLYKATGTIPSGYVGGDSVSVVASATVTAVVSVKVIDEFLVAPPNQYTLSVDSAGRVDVGKFLGTASAGTAGYAGLDWGHVTAPSTTVDLVNTTLRLRSNGLDLIPVTDPGAVATTFPQMVVQTWRLWFKKSIKAVTGLTIKTYADDNVTVRTTQTYTDDGAGNQTRNAAS